MEDHSESSQPIKFTPQEIFELMRRNRALEKKNAELTKQLDSARTQIDILREQYSDVARRGKIMASDKNNRIF